MKHPQQKTAKGTVKKYLTNSDKSIYNLTWEVGGRAQDYYIRSRTPSPLKKIRNRPDRSIKERNARQFWQPPQHEEPWKRSEKSRSMSNIPKSRKVASDKQPRVKSATSSYPHAYPPLRIHEKTSEQMLKPRRITDDRRRRGFIEAGLQSPAVRSRKHDDNDK